METTKVALYLRQSTDKTGDALAVDRQREACLALCASKEGWTVTDEYIDNDVSATSRKPRPQYRQMLADIEAGAVTGVVVYHLDRLHRQPAELEEFITLAEKHKLTLATVTGDVDLSTDDGVFMARIMGAVASKEVMRKTARQKLATAQKAAAGKPHGGGTRPFGYEKAFDTSTGKRVYVGDKLVRREADAVRQAYTSLLAGESLYSIAQRWNSRGLTSTRGKTWTGETVRQVLVNPRYAGLRFHLGAEVAAAQWKPIVTRDRWEAACAVLSDPKRFTGRSPGRRHLLTGIARCGECGQPMGSGVGTGRKPTYVCKHCFKVTRQSALTDAVVIDAVTSRLAQPDAAAVLAKPTVDTAALREQANALRDLITAAESEYDDGVIDGRRLAARKDKVNAKLGVLEAKMLSANTSRVLDGLVGQPDAFDRFARLPLDRQRAVVDTLCTPRIAKSHKGSRFDPTLVTVDWK